MANRGMAEFRVGGVDYAMNDPNVADEFDSTKANLKGDYVYHEGKLYKFITGHSANSGWQPAYLNQVMVGEQTEKAFQVSVGAARKLGGYADINQYHYKTKTYIGPDGSFNDAELIDAYYIPVNPNDIIYIKDKDKNNSIWESFGAYYRVVYRINGETRSLYNNDSNVGHLATSEYGTNEALIIGRTGVNGIFVNLRNDRIDNVLLYINRGTFGNYETVDAVGVDNTVKTLTAENSIPVAYIYPRTGDAANRFSHMFDDQSNVEPKTMYIKVKSGQKIIGDRISQGFGYIGVFNSFDDEIVENFGLVYTAPADGYCCIFRASSDLNTVKIYPKKAIEIQYSSIVDPPEGNPLLLNGKTVATLGDSISNLGAAGWQPMIQELLGGTWVPCAMGSTPLSGSTNEYAFWKDVRLNAVKSANPDFLTILGGANDLVQNPVIGDESNLEDKDTDTFIGAYSYIINNMLTWKPALKIIILSTTWAHNDGADVTETSVRYKDFAAACKKVAEYYHLPYVDLYNESGYNQYTMGNSPNNVYSSDHIHPNILGCKIIASMVIQKIREVYGVT